MRGAIFFFSFFLGMQLLSAALFIETPPSGAPSSTYESFYRELLSNFATQKKINLVFVDAKKANTQEALLWLNRQALEVWDETNRIGLPILPIREMILQNKKGKLRSDGEVLTRPIGILEGTGAAETLADIEKQLRLKVETVPAASKEQLLEKFSRGEAVFLFLESDRAFKLAG
ncbi:MAG: hypothetical protein JNM63_09680, partial [Spirochaetia bacterium]|nr:hypothetical protein [Spirochaetia bacterium]